MTGQEQKQWLIRKNAPLRAVASDVRAPSQIAVLGPFLTDQVRRMVEQGMLDPDDEIGPENGYWFFLHEVEEVKRQIGVEQVVLPHGADRESTKPDLETTAPDLNLPAEDVTPPGFEIEHPTDPGLDPNSTGVIKIKRNSPASGGQPPARSNLPSAAELSNRFQRVGQPSGEAGKAPPVARVRAAENEMDAEPHQAQSSSPFGMEKAQLLKVLIVAGLILAAIGVIWVIRSLQI